MNTNIINKVLFSGDYLTVSQITIKPILMKLLMFRIHYDDTSCTFKWTSTCIFSKKNYAIFEENYIITGKPLKL